MTSVKSITGYHDHLYEHMKESFIKAKKVDIIVSFLMDPIVVFILNLIFLNMKMEQTYILDYLTYEGQLSQVELNGI